MADRRWSAGETVALVEAWRPLYNRRRGGESDVWVPANQRTRARSTGALVVEDWRAVATAVNRFRAEINLVPNRTHKQCQRRVERLKGWFGDEQLATPSWDGFVRVVRNRNSTSGGRFTAAASDFFPGPIPKKRRTGASTSSSSDVAAAADGRACSVEEKEELVREENARRARVDAGRAPAGGFAATTPEVAAVLADLCAAESNDVEAMAKLTEMFTQATTMYKEVVMRRLEVQRQIVMAATATGGAAVPEQDAAPRVPVAGV